MSKWLVLVCGIMLAFYWPAFSQSETYPPCVKIINHVGRIAPGWMCCSTAHGNECVERELAGDSIFLNLKYDGMTAPDWFKLTKSRQSIYWSAKDSLSKAKHEEELKKDSLVAARDLQDSLARVAQINSRKWSKRAKRAVIDRKVFIGMTAEQAIESWGEPDNNNRTISEAGTFEQWVYGSSYLYFTNGKLTTIQN